jgi:hypothetical protein
MAPLLRHKVRNTSRELSSNIGLKERSTRAAVCSPPEADYEQLASGPWLLPLDPAWRIVHAQSRFPFRGSLCILSGMAGCDPGPENLPGILLQAFWRSLADDPVATLLLMASASLGAWCWCCWAWSWAAYSARSSPCSRRVVTYDVRAVT